MLAATWRGDAPTRWAAACAVLGPGAAPARAGADSALHVTGDGPVDGPVSLVCGARIGERDVSAADIAAWLRADGRHRDLDRVVPPFAAVGRDPGTGVVRAATDFLGFRCLYVVQGPDWAAISTSSRALAVLSGAGTDLTSLAAYSLLGWRLGERTHYTGVATLPPGSSVRLAGGRLVTWSASPAAAGDAGDAVRRAAGQLRTSVNALLDDHPDTCLQLTGGLDSRLLLAAVDPDRRGRLAAMTLRAPGNPDAPLAASLARRYGMPHHVVDVDATGEVAPAEAAALALAGAHRVDYSADPLAWASLDVVERAVSQGPRLSGLGGEVVRGFYYLGPPRRTPTTPRRVAGLARWRLFPNESVPDDVLDPGFAASRREVTLGELERIFAELPGSWAQATDGFYLWQRMRRWAGATTTSTCQQRFAVNPMLDPRFVGIGAGVPPRDRAQMRFLSRILVELDPALAARPLDGRPAPTVYADPTLANRARLGALTVHKAGRKVRQRVRATTRPPEGGVQLADRVLAHWRADPTGLGPLHDSSVLRPGVVDRILDGDLDPGPSTVGFLATLAAAGEGVR